MGQFLTLTKLHWLRKVAVGLGIIASLAVTTPAWAVYITTNGTIQMATPFPDPDQTGANPPLTEITQISAASGRIFTNQESGAPFAIGSTVRSVGTVSFTQAINGDNLPILLPDGTPVAVIFAVEGTIIASPGGPTAFFTGGSFWLASRVTENPGGFSRDNPLSWNFDDAFAKFDLLPSDAILPGALFGIEGGAVFAPASSVNVSALNSIAGAVDGIFAFQEDLAFVPAAGFTNPGLGAFVGPEWLRDVESPPLVPNQFEGLAAFTDQTINTGHITLTAAQIAALDAISAAAFNFTGVFSAGGYTPAGTNEVPTGDFNADLSSENYVIAAAIVPEPASIVIFGLGAGLFGLAGCLRRRKANGIS